MAMSCRSITSSDSLRMVCRPFDLSLLVRTLASAWPKHLEFRATTDEQESATSRSWTSPTSTDTTGRLQARASLRIFGDPSLWLASARQSDAFKYIGTSSG